MTVKNKSIPDKMSIREASEFWDEHSVVDYDSHIIEFEYVSDDPIMVANTREKLNPPQLAS